MGAAGTRLQRNSTARRRRQVAWVLIGLVVMGILGVQLNKSRNVAVTERYLTKFTPVPELGTFKESSPLVYGGQAKFKHAVLLLHGYSASPQEFEELAKHLQDAGIPYYAPQIAGFGLNDLHLIASTRPDDWLREAVQAYDLLAAMADEVSVVGHSNGGAMAVYIAEHRPVRHLILSGPNLLPSPSDRSIKQMLNTPVLSQVLQAVMPVFVKPVREGRVANTDTIEPVAAQNAFHYPALPIGTLKTLWAVQDRADITKAKYQDLTLVYGEKDLSVDMPTIIKFLDDRGIKYTRHAFSRSGHNVLEDYDKVEASKAVVEVLKR